MTIFLHILEFQAISLSKLVSGLTKKYKKYIVYTFYFHIIR